MSALRRAAFRGCRGRSPRPATPTGGGCWSRRPGTTARRIAIPDHRCGRVGPKLTPHSRRVGMPATGACTSSGAGSPNAGNHVIAPCGKPRALWMVLVVGHPELTNTHELDRSRPVGGEIGELGLRNSYEPQPVSMNHRVTPVPREQPPFALNHRLAVPNPGISVTPPSLTNDRRGTDWHRSNESAQLSPGRLSPAPRQTVPTYQLYARHTEGPGPSASFSRRLLGRISVQFCSM
jgi:hypothetical protein